MFRFSEKKTSLNEKLEDYSSSFSIHGLSRTIHTDSHLERFFWIVALLLALGIAFLMVRSLIDKFWTEDVYKLTDTRITATNTFPAVTLCSTKILVKNMYCSLQADDVEPVYVSPSCRLYGYWNIVKNKKSNVIDPIIIDRGIAFQELHIDNQVAMSFSCPTKEACLNLYLERDYFNTDEQFESCVTWNYGGNFNNTNNIISLQIETGKRSTFYVYIHDHRESPMHQDLPIMLSNKLNVQLTFEKKVVKRLARDPPNHCESQEYNNKKNIFPGKYTREACVDTYKCLEVLKHCGDILNFCEGYLTNDLLEKYWQNGSLFEKHSCIYDGFVDRKFEASQEDCPPPCEQVRFYSSQSVTAREVNDNAFIFTMAYKERNVYEYEEEKTVYTWEDFIAGIGGMIGLFCGFSILSLAELIVYIGLMCFAGATSIGIMCRGEQDKRTMDTPPPTTPQSDYRAIKGQNNEAMDQTKEKGSEEDFDLNVVCS